MTPKLSDRLDLKRLATKNLSDQIATLPPDGAGGDFFSFMQQTRQPPPEANPLTQATHDPDEDARSLPPYHSGASETPSPLIALQSLLSFIAEQLQASTEKQISQSSGMAGDLHASTSGEKYVGLSMRERESAGNAQPLIAPSLANEPGTSPDWERRPADSKKSLHQPAQPAPDLPRHSGTRISLPSLETYLPTEIIRRLPSPVPVDVEATTQSDRPVFETGQSQPVKILAIHLEPEHLGALEIRIRSSDKGCSISINAETEQSASAIESVRHRLVERLETTGVKVEALELRVSAPAFDSVNPPADMAQTNWSGSGRTHDGHQHRRSRQSGSIVEDRSDTDGAPPNLDRLPADGVYM